MGRLDGKTAIITGGARGQGRAHAVRFAQEGANVVVSDIAHDIPGVPYPLSTPDDLAETLRLVEEAGGTGLALEADVRRPAELDAVVQATLDRFGRIDVLAANAGIIDHGSWDVSDENWATMLDVDLTGVFYSCRAVIPTMIAQRSGSIVCTSSSSGARPLNGLVPYVVAKHGVVGLVRALAADLGQYSIRVNAVLPTAVVSGMFDNDWNIGAFANGKPGATLDDTRFPASTMNMLPVDFFDPAEVSNAVLWLASDEARYVTALELHIDAGSHQQPPGVPQRVWQYVHPPTPGEHIAAQEALRQAPQR